MIRGVEGLVTESEDRAKQGGAILRRLAGELAPHRGQIALTLGIIVLSSSSQALGPWLVGRAIDGPVLHHDLPGLGRLLVVMLVVYVIGALSTRAQMRQIGTIGQQVLAGLRVRLFGRMQALPIGFFDKQAVGDLMSRVSNDVDTLNQILSQGLTQVVGALLSLCGIVIAMLALQPRLGLACLAVIPLMLITLRLLANRARAAFRETRKTTGAVMADLQEEIEGMRESQAFNRAEANMARFRERNAANRDANIAATAVSSAYSPSVELLGALANVLVIGYGSYLVFHGQLTVGLVASFLFYVQQFFRPIQLTAQVAAQSQAALAGAERIYAIMDSTAETADPLGAKPLARAEGRIAFEGVSFGYLPDRMVLDDVSFEVEPGQMVAIVGPTGAGKTTIANLLPRFYDPNRGTIRLDDVDVRLIARADLRRQLAIVPQEPFLFSATIAENLAYGRPEATREEIEATAREVGLHDVIAALPQGYDTRLGAAGTKLSQGQRQLLSIARAVLADRPILILDEATSNVDTRTEARLQKAMARLLAGRTSLVIAHRLSTVRHADQILVVAGGRIVERGTHEELIALGGRYADLYRTQFGARIAAPSVGAMG
jgi:ATP-binding cassette subfamily B protein/subfamily B ATP-binding cassette protein MsbA